jgi:hypothetical protein
VDVQQDEPMTARIAPANAPFSPEVQRAFERTLPVSIAPVTLFTSLGRDDERCFTVCDDCIGPAP